jgi:hypothetical protein
LTPASPRNPFAHGFQLDQLGLHLAHLLRDGVEVFAHEAVTLGDFIAHDQAHQGADHGPAFARSLQEDEVVNRARQAHQQAHQHQRRQHELPGAESATPACAPGCRA